MEAKYTHNKVFFFFFRFILYNLAWRKQGAFEAMSTDDRNDC